MKITKFNEFIQRFTSAPDKFKKVGKFLSNIKPIDNYNKKVELWIIEDVLEEAIKNGEIDMINISLEKLMSRISNIGMDDTGPR